MTINRLNQGVTNQVLVKAVSGQTTNLLELQDSTGAVVSSIGPTGALGGTIGNSGLVHIETADLAGQVSQSFDNIFTSSFRNYKIIYDAVHSTTSSIELRLRVSGADNVTSNYIVIGAFATSSSAAGFRAASSKFFLSGSALNSSQSDVTLFKPTLSQPTTGLSLVMSNDTDFRMVGLNFSANTVFDGFSLIISAGTITSGSVSVYGLKD